MFGLDVVLSQCCTSCRRRRPADELGRELPTRHGAAPAPLVGDGVLLLCCACCAAPRVALLLARRALLALDRARDAAALALDLAARRRRRRVLILGLDCAGKTTLLHVLRTGRVRAALAPTRHPHGARLALGELFGARRRGAAARPPPPSSPLSLSRRPPPARSRSRRARREGARARLGEERPPLSAEGR